MNAFRLMLSKEKVQYLYSNHNLADALELFIKGSFSAVPVVREDGTYLGTVCDKDFLCCCERGTTGQGSMEQLEVKDIIRKDWNPAINVYTDVDEVLLMSMNQNFLPVVDDDNMFIGIITRRAIISFLSENNKDFGGVDKLPALANQYNLEKVMQTLEKESMSYQMFFKMYETAMKEVCNRIETINEFLCYKYNRKPLHHIEHRLKSLKSIVGKLGKKNLPLTMDSIRGNLFDIAGVRAICAYLNDVYEFADYIAMQEDIEVLQTKDYIKSPKENGYRSLHLIVKIPVHFLEARQFLPVEIQFRTEPMDYWASLEHDLHYKPIQNDNGVDITKQLIECSCALAETEKKMQNLARLIGSNVEDEQEGSWQKSWV